MSNNSKIQEKISNWQKLFLVFFGAALFIVILELGLRLGGFILLSVQEHRNTQTIRQKGAYRIMCLGESTTRWQYPRFLEEILNQRNIGIKFSVIDKGIGATNTGAILSQLEYNLDKYKPDMVVVMMGINDGGRHMPVEAATDSRIMSFFKSLRVYKMTRLLWLHIITKAKELGLKVVYADQNSLVQQEEILKNNIELNQNSYQACFDLGTFYKEQGNLPEAEEFFKKAIAADRKREGAYIGLGDVYIKLRQHSRAEESLKKAIEINPKSSEAYFQLGRFYKNNLEYLLAENMLQKAIELNPGNFMAAVDLSETYVKEKKYKQAENILQKALELNPANDWLYGALAVLYTEKKDYESASRVSKIANKLRVEFYNPETRHNYNKLKEILNRKGARFVCVQYPIRSIIPLKNIFKEEGQVIFVDNEKIFKDAVRKDGYKEYFTDIFAGDFGHCTKKGNWLLAKNIADVILKEIFGK